MQDYGISNALDIPWSWTKPSTSLLALAAGIYQYSDLTKPIPAIGIQ